MPDYNRYRVNWTGGPGGAGVSTFFTLSSSGSALADIRSFFDAIKAKIASDITWDFPAAGDVLDLPSGTLTGAWAETPVASVSATGIGNYAAGVGCRVVWETGGIVGGRRVRGATYLTSLASAAYQTDGTLGAATISDIETAANALVGAVDLAVWSRTTSGVSSVASARVPDRVSWLTTRRQ